VECSDTNSKLFRGDRFCPPAISPPCADRLTTLAHPDA
jgi:hypothetical protein